MKWSWRIKILSSLPSYKKLAAVFISFIRLNLKRMFLCGASFYSMTLMIFPSSFTSSLKKKLTFMTSLAAAHFSALAHVHSSATSPFIHLLENCMSMEQIKEIHSHAIRKHLACPTVNAKIIAFCCTHALGNMKYAHRVFDEIPEPNVFIWNTMIKGYSRVNCPEIAVSKYTEMLRRSVTPDNYTFPFLFKGFASDIALKCGGPIHAHISKFGFVSNESVQHSLIHIYCLCGQIDIARGVFDMSLKVDVLIWNAMISGYNRSKHFKETKNLFDAMEEKNLVPNLVTLVSVLSACSELKDLDAGKRVHKYVKDGEVESNLVLENVLLHMYAACGEMDVALGMFKSMKRRDVISWTTMVTGFVNSGQVDLAQNYFDQMPERDCVTWTAMIDGYVRQNQFKEVLMLFREMQKAKVKPDEFTMVSILTACAHLGALELGEWIEAYIDKNKIKNDVCLGNALIDMYFKCGSIENATRIFSKMTRKDKFTWTVMVIGLAINGHGEAALDMFSQMTRASVTPDEITYIGVLCACTHTGMVDAGRKFFASMITEYGIEPNVTHYGCLVDLLGRAGQIQEAYEAIKNMPMKPNSVVWGALLGACRVYKNIEMSEMAAKQLLHLEPQNGAGYILLCNIYAACKRWEDLREIRRIMMDRGIKKIPGCSMIEMNGLVHEFVASDQSHPQSEEIYSKLEKITEDLRLAGYSPDTSEVFQDIGEEEKENSVDRHSEKLAMAFGLISSGPGVTIRIVKNLRMCVDCHHVAKLVSQIYDRELIARDRTQFHRVSHGLCSCKDYW